MTISKLLNLPSRWAWVFVIVAFAIRLPLMFLLDLHPDEQTFINMAHDVAMGHLPYMHSWDNKPPLLFILMAPITMIAHHQICIVRLFATALDISTGLLIKSISDRLFGRGPGGWIAAVWWFAAITVRDGGGALMSETVALPFLMFGSLLLSSKRPRPTQAFLAGVCLGISTLVRASPVFPSVAVVAVILCEGLIGRDRQLLSAAALVILGGSLTLALVAFPYIVTGEIDMLLRSIWSAPQAYVQERGQSSLIGEFTAIASSRSIGAAFLFGIPSLLFYTISGNRSTNRLRVGAMWIALFLGLTMAPAGAFYLITLMPFACIFAAPLFSYVVTVPTPAVARVGLAACLLSPAIIAAGVAVKQGRANSPMVATRQMLAQEMRSGDSLYLTTDYLLYWLLERSPPHPLVTHAGNLFRPGMFSVLPYGVSTSADLIRAVLEKRPTWIVLGADTEGKYERGTDVGNVFQSALAANYVSTPSPAGRKIYRLRDVVEPVDELSSRKKK